MSTTVIGYEVEVMHHGAAICHEMENIIVFFLYNYIQIW